MNETDWKTRKLIIGALAIGCWVVSAYLYFVGSAAYDDAQLGFLMGISNRCGTLLTVLWFALPTAKRPAAWANMSGKWWGTMVVGLILITIRPRLAIYILPILIILRFLWKPKQKKRPAV